MQKKNNDASIFDNDSLVIGQKKIVTDKSADREEKKKAKFEEFQQKKAEKRKAFEVELATMTKSAQRRTLNEQKLKKNLANKIFGYLHEPWERMRWQKAFCRVSLSRFWMSEIIFFRGIPLGRIFSKKRRGVF